MKTYHLVVTDYDDSTGVISKSQYQFTPELWRFTDAGTFGVIMKRVIKDLSEKVDELTLQQNQKLNDKPAEQ